MRPPAVVMRRVRSQDMIEVPASEHQDPVQALATNRLDPALYNGVRCGCSDRGQDHVGVARAEHLIEGDGELRVAVVDQEADGQRLVFEVHGQVPGLLSDPGCGWMGRRRAHVDPPAVQLNEDEHVEGAQPHSLHSEEVTSDDPARLGAEELRPRGTESSRRGTETSSAQECADGGRAYADPQLPSSPEMRHIPPGVLASQPQDEFMYFCIEWQPSPAPRRSVCPLAPHQLTVPPQSGLWSDHEGSPTLSTQHSAQRRQEHTIPWAELWWAALATQHPELMPEDEDLEISRPGVLTSAPQQPRQCPRHLEQKEEHRGRATDRPALTDQGFGPPQGGQGMAEQYSGLPIDARTVRCDYAKHQVGSANNMEWIAIDLYRENCVGCPHLWGLKTLANHAAAP